MQKPAFFDAVQNNAKQTWAKLEGDPELRGPWDLLFRQIQDPRHIVSELLQNADDAGATQANIIVDGNEFVFTHNGQDFTEENFSSLCKFACSNKRVLHTIGFRGIGFKSVFSIGDEVRLFSPTLSVMFQKSRFTVPLWIDEHNPNPVNTVIRIAISDDARKQAVQKNMQAWFKNPAALLFFRNIRGISIDNCEIRWNSEGAGPVENSEWISLSTAPDSKYLLVRSEPEPFPPDALREIKEERGITDADLSSFPSCDVNILLGHEGSLFVVLPTEVTTDLPFACNAPFILGPDRVRIKAPELSPTNVWLLERAGRLAGDTMLAWLENEELPIEQRAQAYALYIHSFDRDNTLRERPPTSRAKPFIEESGD